MGSVRARKENGKLFLDFRYRNHRCREQTALDDTSENRKKLGKLLEKVEAEITLGSFEYRRYFPGSSLAQHFDGPPLIIQSMQGSNPRFKDFTETWYEERIGISTHKINQFP
ncbi:MAG: DUF3596 domain-containing protein [Sedimenticola sp.]